MLKRACKVVKTRVGVKEVEEEGCRVEWNRIVYKEGPPCKDENRCIYCDVEEPWKTERECSVIQGDEGSSQLVGGLSQTTLNEWEEARTKGLCVDLQYTNRLGKGGSASFNVK